MNKDDLKKLGIEDENVIQQIIVLHGKDIEQHKSALTTTQSELEAMKRQYSEASQTIEGFRKLDVDGIKKAADEWKAKAEQAQADAQAQISKIKFDTALIGSLSAAKARNAKAVQALLNLADLKLAEDGSIIGLNEQLEQVKKDNPYLFDTEEPPVPQIIAGGSGKAAVNDTVVIAARKAAGLKTD